MADLIKTATYIPYVTYEQFRQRVMVSYGFEAGYSGVSRDVNPGKSADERAWWLEGWQRGSGHD